MPARKSGRFPVPRVAGASPLQSTGMGQLSATSIRWWCVSAGLLGLLLVWSLLQPVDAVSVFLGAALPQNLGWLALATLTTAGCVACGVRFQFTLSSWCLIGGGLAWLLIATVLAGRDNNPRLAWNGAWQVIALGACYFSSSALLLGPKSRRAVLQILLVGCVALSLQGLLQVFVEMPAQRARYLADPGAFLAEDPELDLPLGSPARKRFEDRLLYSAEPYATFALTNSLAVLLSGGLIVLGGIGAATWGRRLEELPGKNNRDRQGARSGWISLLAWGLALSLMAACWFLTRSRVAYLALGVGGVAWLWGEGGLFRRSRRLLLGLMVFSAVAVAAGVLWLWRNDPRVLSEATISFRYRLEYWTATVDMLVDHGLWGVGLGNYQSYYPLYKLPSASEIVADPHNWLLDLCVTLSLPVGLLLIGWIFFRITSSSHKSGARGNATESGQAVELLEMLDVLSQRYLLWAAGVGGAFCLGLLGLLSAVQMSTIAVTWVVSAGLIFAAHRMLDEHPATQRRTVRAAILTMLVCLLASGSWQASGLAVPLLLMLVVSDERTVRQQLRPVPRDAVEPKTRSSVARSPQPRLAQAVIIGLPALGLLCFLMQAWRPTTMSWSLMQQAQIARSFQSQLLLVNAAVEADPLDTEPMRWRAELLATQAAVTGKGQFEALSEQSVEAFDALLARDSTKYLNWELAGKHSLELAAQAQRLGDDPQKWLGKSLGYYDQAVARYPSSIGLRMQLASVLSIAGRWTEAQQQWEIASELDAGTEHADRKLASQQLWLPMLPSGAPAELAAQQPRVPAELMLDWLRKYKSSENR